MKLQYIALFFVLMALPMSCIEEYDAAMEDTDNETLVVEGHIVGDTDCEFIIQFSTVKHDDYVQNGPNLVYGANVYVVCSNGEVFGATQRNDGHYYVNVGRLDPEETYHLQIRLRNDGVYESEPMHPMPTPALKKVDYALANDSTVVQLRITNEDPQGEAYYLWTYDEHWEVNTPLFTDWEFDRQTGKIRRVEQRTHRGWVHNDQHPHVVGHNLDYGNGAVSDYVIYTLPIYDKRFNTRYHTRVYQTAISRKEYEYYKQLEAQASQTGGLFTVMPAQLPGNIHHSNGLKAEGYVGVHQNSSSAEVYINREDVKYFPTRSPKIIPDSVVRKDQWYSMVQSGYRVYQYDLTLNAASWTEAWSVDCRDPYWGATLERPDFWNY